MVLASPVVSLRRSPRARRAPLPALALAAGLAMAASPALAQTRLSMEFERPVIDSGESVGVQVFGHFPAHAFALARAQFDIHAPAPTWGKSSSGFIAGPTVQGGVFEQSHVPSGAVQADPTNPMPIWAGDYRPDVAGPALLQLSAEATSYAWYPSAKSSSTTDGNAAPGRGYLWVDPVQVPRAGVVAPGEGTAIEVQPDDRIVATSGDDMLIGLLLPAVQQAREAAARMETDARPHRGVVQALLADGSVRGGAGELALEYTLVDPADPESMYDLTVHAPNPAAAILLCLIGPHGELICQLGLTGEPIARVGAIARGKVDWGWKLEEGEAVMSIEPGQPLMVEIPGKFKGEVAGPIEAHVTSYSLGVLDNDHIVGQVVELTGLPAGVKNRATFTFNSGACIADFDGDGELTVFDFLAYQNAFALGLRSADIDGDDALTIFDFLAFQNAFAKGC